MCRSHSTPRPTICPTLPVDVENNRPWRCITKPPRRHTTPTPWSGDSNYGREKEVDSSLFNILFWVFSVPVFCIFYSCICCCHEKAPSDGADTTINREIGSVHPPEAPPYTEGTTTPYGSIDQADNSLPTYNQALSMPSSYGHMPVPLLAPSLDDGRSPPAYSEINMQLSISAIRVSTVGWAARSPVASDDKILVTGHITRSSAISPIRKRL